VVGLGVVASLHGEVATYQGLAPGSLLATGVLVELLFRTPPVGWTPTRAGLLSWGSPGCSRASCGCDGVDRATPGSRLMYQYTVY
jgi:hypothetical protein